jgi:hypothetical protein
LKQAPISKHQIPDNKTIISLAEPAEGAEKKPRQKIFKADDF